MEVKALKQMLELHHPYLNLKSKEVELIFHYLSQEETELKTIVDWELVKRCNKCKERDDKAKD